MKKFSVLLLPLLMLGVVCFSQAPVAKKLSNPQWKQVVMIDFQEGKLDRAMTIINDYFEKAGQKANVPGPELTLRLMSGEWDLMLVWGFKNGVEDMNWEMHPDDVVWLKALGELAGSPEKGKAVWDEYVGLINRTSVQLARVP
jgi:hypothetical protein